MRQIEYLIYILGEGKLYPRDRKVEAIKDFPEPIFKHEIRRFIGLVSFFRRFIVGFSKIAAYIIQRLKLQSCIQMPLLWAWVQFFFKRMLREIKNK